MKHTLIEILQRLLSGFLAGLLISIGGAVFLACYAENKFVGALLFSVALLCICIKGFSLYTGKIGYLPEKHSRDDLSVLLLGLAGNLLGTVACGYLIAFLFPSLKEVALTLCNGKLAQQPPYLGGCLRAVLCGILVYLAVDIYRSNKSVLGIVFCIPVFILSGYEHSIADMFYFAASGIVSWEAFGYLWMIILGNSVGALLFHLAVMLLRPKKPSGPAPSEKDE